MNGFLKRAAVLSLLCGGVLHATSQFRSPLSLEWGVMHYPLRDVDQTWWIDEVDPDCCRDTLWNVYAWAGYYHRAAAKSFYNPCSPCSNTRKKTTLSQLFFNQTSFRVEQIFEGGFLDCDLAAQVGAAGNPFLRFANITPDFDYSESGAVFGLQAERRVGCSQNWKVGGRISIPYKVIEIEQNNFGSAFEEGLEDVVYEQPIDLAAQATDFLYDYAYRLDFLSCLIRPAMPGSTNKSLALLNFGPTQATPPSATVIKGTTIGFPQSQLSGNDAPPVFLIKRNDGSVPVPTFIDNPANKPPVMVGKQLSQVTGQLPADGSGVENGVYFFGDVSVNYAGALANDRDTQATLWVVPHVNADGAQWAGTKPQSVRNAVKALIDGFSQGGDLEASAFLANNGVELLEHSYVTGIGDIRTEFYGGWDACDAFAYLIFGVLIPTGRPMSNSNFVYFQTPGNNRHGEVCFGATGGWRPYNWFAFQLRGSVHHACKHNEKKAAAFKGSTVINIGPEVDANVSWTYGIFRADFTLFHPCNEDLGVVFGYELWGKTKDHVEFCQQNAVDFFGNVAPLDACLLENNTNSMTQKLRGELFFRRYFFEIFAGGSQVLAGRHAMQESEVHLGFAFYF